MNQYEKSRSLHLIHGHWIPRPAASDKQFVEDFLRAKRSALMQLAKTSLNVGEISFEEFLQYIGPNRLETFGDPVCKDSEQTNPGNSSA
jgi:hypothetical protein